MTQYFIIDGKLDKDFIGLMFFLTALYLIPAILLYFALDLNFFEYIKELLNITFLGILGGLYLIGIFLYIVIRPKQETLSKGGRT